MTVSPKSSKIDSCEALCRVVRRAMLIISAAAQNKFSICCTRVYPTISRKECYCHRHQGFALSVDKGYYRCFGLNSTSKGTTAEHLFYD